MRKKLSTDISCSKSRTEQHRLSRLGRDSSLSPVHTSCECEGNVGDATIGTRSISLCDAMKFASHEAFAASMNQALI